MQLDCSYRQLRQTARLLVWTIETERHTVRLFVQTTETDIRLD